ncbi:acyltransferase family protein [Streptomyces sp. NPDC004296]|uniref:acyltransferase family protein n=1 Tax=Streptomyces sp. NPDC004296 TaxID=3364697 RepID=UPI003675458F
MQISLVSFIRLPSLTGLRFVAALGVFVCHAALLTARDEGGWPPPVLFLLGAVGVSLFFVLSGFVLTLSAQPTDTARSFWRRRIAKIYPNHLVVWVALISLFRWAGMPRQDNELPHPAPSWLGDLANALLINNLIPLPKFLFAGNPVTWSLTCELVFYLLFPLLIPMVVRLRQQWLLIAAIGAVAATWVIPLISLGLHGQLLPHGFMNGRLTAPQFGLVYGFPLSRLPEFILGMILARMHANGSVGRIGVIPSVTLLAVCLPLGIAVLPAPFYFSAVTIIPVALTVRAVASGDAHGARSLLRTPGMVLLGNVSYAFYLVHAMILAVTLYYCSGWGAVTSACVAFLVALVASWLLYTLIERPCFQRLTTVNHRPSSQPKQIAQPPVTEPSSQG